MVTRRNRPEIDAECTGEELRRLLEERTLEVTELRRKITDLENQGNHFLSAASHAVMNPLTIIQSYLEIVLSDLQGGLSGQQLEFVKTAHAATLRLHELIDSIVELAALELGAAEIEMGTVDLGDLVAGVCTPHMPQAETGGVELSVTIPPNLPRVRADAERLENAVGAVISNAVEWTPQGGRVAVTASHRGAEVVVEVTDTGPGISEEHLGQVFDPFVRLPRRDGGPRRGAGLGLSIARRQIEAMGGRIEVASEIGGGSTFEVRLPAPVEDLRSDRR